MRLPSLIVTHSRTPNESHKGINSSDSLLLIRFLSVTCLLMIACHLLQLTEAWLNALNNAGGVNKTAVCASFRSRDARVKRTLSKLGNTGPPSNTGSSRWSWRGGGRGQTEGEQLAESG